MVYLDFVEVCEIPTKGKSPRFSYYFVERHYIGPEGAQADTKIDTDVFISITRLPSTGHPLITLFWWLCLFVEIAAFGTSLLLWTLWPLLSASVILVSLGVFAHRVVNKSIIPKV